MKILNPRNMIRKERYSIEEVLSKAKPFMHLNKSKQETKADFDGDSMKMASDRYKCFINSGIKCVCCGIRGRYFYKEKDRGQKREVYHFNLYALDSDGNEIMMTKDHIIPKSKGGKDKLDNYQTMCSNCNEAKGDSIAV